MKRVLFRPQAVRDLEDLLTQDRDLVEDTTKRFAKTGAGDVKMLAGACHPATPMTLAKDSKATHGVTIRDLLNERRP